MTKIKVDETKDKEEVGFDSGTCPYCGGMDLHYDAIEVEDDNAFYEVDCEDCGNSFREYYELNFSGQWGYPLKKKTKKGKK
jgi:DNA-directed RNA polymerase subunit M/transcription elongation factor TFIIS